MCGFRYVHCTQAFLSCFGPIRQHFALPRYQMDAHVIADTQETNRRLACLDRRRGIRAYYLIRRSMFNEKHSVCSACAGPLRIQDTAYTMINLRHYY